MIQFLHAKASFTLRDGEHRFHRLERRFHHVYQNMVQHMYVPGFNQRQQILVAVFTYDFLGSSWSKIKEGLESLRLGFVGQEFFVDRLKIEVPALELGAFKELQMPFLYFLVTEQILCPRHLSPALLEICSGHGVMAILDSIPARLVEGHDVWDVVGKYEYQPHGALKAEDEFSSVRAEFQNLGINLGRGPTVTAVIFDDAPEEDLVFVAPPFPGGEIDARGDDTPF